MFRQYPEVHVDQTLPNPINVGDTLSAGVSQKAARVDHKHGPVLGAQSAVASGAGAATTTSTTPVSLTDMGIVITTRASTKVRVDMTGTFWVSVADKPITLGFYVDGTLQRAQTHYCSPGGASQETLLTTFAVITGLAVGSHTFEVRWNTAAGTTATSDGSRHMMVQELAA